VHPWYEPAQQGAEQAAAELGAELVWAAPAQADIAEQNQLLESLLAKGMDGLCLNTLSATAQNQVVKEIMDAGVEVIMFGNDAPTSGRLMFIGTGSMVEKGIVQATKMVELIGGKGKVAILTGEIGVTSFDDQIAGNMQVYDQYPDIEVVAIEPDYDDFAKALANAETIMLMHPDLAGFVGTDQTSLPAAARAVSDAGKAGEIKLVGIDLPPETADWMRKGVIQLTYIQDPYLMGYWGVYYLVSAIHGNRIPSNIDTGSLWVDQSNVDLYSPPE
jgi:ABC-type sugar transport system substrate-binding protein